MSSDMHPDSCPECGHTRLILPMSSKVTWRVSADADPTAPPEQLALVCPYCGFVTQLEPPTTPASATISAPIP